MKAAILVLVPMVAMAQEMPLLLGTIPNRDNAKITFTTYQGDCEGNDRVVYSQAEGGRVAITGCYRMVGENFFVIWQDGEIYTYPWTNLTMTKEMERYLESRK